MGFDEQLKRIVDAAVAELTDIARADAEQARQEGHEAGRVLGVEEGRALGFDDGHQKGRVAGLEEARRETGTAPLDGVLDGFRALDRARSLSEILDTVAACAGREAARAAVLLTRNGRIRGWRYIGFEPTFTGRSSETDIADAGPIADAIAKGSGTGSAEIPALMSPGSGRCFAQPLDVAGSVVAVLYADGFDEQAHAAGVEQRLEALGRHAARALEAVIALRAAGAAAANAPALTPGADNTDDADSAARRYAKLLISEIKLYHEPAVVAGRRDRDLATRLGGEIARARVLYEQRVPQAVRVRTDYFRDELVRTLANGDATLLQLT